MNNLLTPVEIDLPEWVQQTAAQIDSDAHREAYLAAARTQTVRNLTEMALRQVS
jgi:hypothetical protein